MQQQYKGSDVFGGHCGVSMRMIGRYVRLANERPIPEKWLDTCILLSGLQGKMPQRSGFSGWQDQCCRQGPE